MSLLITCIAVLIAVSTMIYTYICASEKMAARLQSLQKELRESRNAVLELLPELADGKAATWQINRKTMVMTFEDDYASKIGMPHADWGIAAFRDICNPDCLDVFDKWIGQYSKLTDPVLRRLRFHITNDGGKTYHWWELIYNLNDVTSKTQYFRGMFVNIDRIIDLESDIDDARNKLYESELKQTFFASINHDLRTPINAIAGFGNLLAAQYNELSDEDRKSFADIVQTNCDMLMQLLSDFSTMNCNDVEKMRFKPRNKSVNELINVVYQTNKMICPSHLKFILETEDKSSDKTIFVDSKRVEQVVNNFLSNSFKFTQAGFVKLGWKYMPDSDEAELYVEDTGIGIKKENLSNLFKQFFKIHEHAHGSGLGLNICKTIVEKQDGTIGVESTYGKGSTFYCRFKVAKAA